MQPPPPPPQYDALFTTQVKPPDLHPPPLNQQEEVAYDTGGSKYCKHLHAAIVSDTLPCVFAGYCSYRFFLCFLHFGKPVNAYNVDAILILSLLMTAGIVVHLKQRNSFPLRSTVIAVLSICIGGFFARFNLASTLSDETYLGLGPKYNLNRTAQAHLIPLLYGVMHVCLIIFALLPLTMCRMLIRAVMSFEADFMPTCFPSYVQQTSALTHFLHLHSLYGVHRFLGYSLCIGLYVGAVAWWIAMYFSCAQYGEGECEVFLPAGSFFDIRGAPWFCEEADLEASSTKFRDEVIDYDSCLFEDSGNPGAVLFLRILVTLAVCTMFAASTLKYPLANTSSEGPSFPYNTVFWKTKVEPNSFEIFMYAHILGADAIAMGAFFSRFEVFYPTFTFWVLFAIDKIVAYLSITKLDIEKVGHPAHVAESTSILQLTLDMRSSLFRFKAGQIVYLRCWQLSMFEWHPFSIASSNVEGEVRLLIKIHKEGSWTRKLQQVLAHPNSLRSLSVKGPFGSTFQDLHQNDFVMLIGTSTGIAGALSVVDDIAHRRNSKTKVWFVWSTRDLSDVRCVASDLRKAVTSTDGSTETRIRATIHVTAKQGAKEIANLTEEVNSPAADEIDPEDIDPDLEERTQDLRFAASLLRSGRPVWRTYFQSFAASCVLSSVTKGKICVCTSQSAIMADVKSSLESIDFPSNVDIEFTSENFQ
jgi:ferredoxin-NADP reductase